MKPNSTGRRRVLHPLLGSILILSAILTSSPQQPTASRTLDWRLHNLDLAGTRFSPANQINATNVKSLTPRWLFQHGVIDGVSNQTTTTSSCRARAHGQRPLLWCVRAEDNSDRF